MVVLRGTAVNPWDLRPFEDLGPGYAVRVLEPANNLYDASALGLEREPVRTLGARLPGGRAGALMTRAAGAVSYTHLTLPTN